VDSGLKKPKVTEPYSQNKKPATLKVTNDMTFEFHSDAFEDSSDDDEEIWIDTYLTLKKDGTFVY